MARTYRKVPEPSKYWDEGFVDKLRRGHVKMEIDSAEGPFDTTFGDAGKRSAKKKKRRDRRREGNKSIREHLDDLNL